VTTSAQQARRARILAAALELAATGGYDAVQMREVAERSDVALGTLYRYFPSKVHLLVAAMVEELERVRDRLQRRPVPAGSARERVTYVLERSTRSLQREPRLAEALVRAFLAADASVAAEVTEVRRLMGGLIVEALRGDGPARPDDQARADVLQDVWFARHIAWLGGQVDRPRVWQQVQDAIALVLPD
jgi:AcrR family transcriptional regulator